MASADQALVDAARAGDRRAIDELLARYEPAIYRFGLRMCKDPEAAREVLQETLLAAFRNLPGFRGQASLSTWLYQIARSFCIKQHRGVRPEEEVDTELTDHAPSPEVQVATGELGKALAAAIDALPAEQREVLLLRDVEGLTAEEAAEVVGIEIGALKSRLHRARMALRKRLAGVLDGGGTEPCAELAQTLSAYAAAEIDQSACARIEGHLRTCPRCTAACDALKRTVTLCKQAPGGEVPQDLRDQVRSALLAVIG